MKKIAAIVVAFTLCSFQAEAFSTGAPSFACGTLIPGHSPNQAGNVPFPYEVDLSAFGSFPCYKGGQNYRSKLC